MFFGLFGVSDGVRPIRFDLDEITRISFGRFAKAARRGEETVFMVEVRGVLAAVTDRIKFTVLKPNFTHQFDDVLAASGPVLFDEIEDGGFQGFLGHGRLSFLVARPIRSDFIKVFCFSFIL